MLKGVIFRVIIRIITLDGSWIIPNFSSNLCPTHQPKFAHGTNISIQHSCDRTPQEKLNPESFKKEKTTFAHTQTCLMVFQSWIMPPPSQGSPGVAGSVLGGEISSPALPVLQGGTGVQLMLTPVNTRPCFDKGLKGRHRVQSCLEEMWGGAGMVSCSARFPGEVSGAVSHLGKAPLCALTPCRTLTPCTTPHCHWTWVQPSQARIHYFITCYFQLCCWRFTATAKPSHSLSLCFISPSTEQKLQYLPPFMNSNRWCMIPIIYSILMGSREILPLGAVSDEQEIQDVVPSQTFSHPGLDHDGHCWQEEISLITSLRHINSLNLVKASQIPEAGRKGRLGI